jgi:large subunit ribosomal protein L9
MEVILLERVEKLGEMGDVVRVKDGFARNFLLPQKKALRASKENRERFERQRVDLEAKNRQKRSEAEAVAARMAGLAVTILRQAGDAGQLYGSVSARDVALAIAAAGFPTDRRQVQLIAPIKSLGLQPVRVSLHPEVTATVNVNIARSEAEAAAQAPTPEETVAFFEVGAGPKTERPETESPKTEGLGEVAEKGAPGKPTPGE